MIENSAGEEKLSFNATMEESRTAITSILDNQNVKSRKPKRIDVCKLCFKAFTNSSNYKYHMAHHSNECLWICNECPKSYKTKADLQRHQQIHLKTHGSFQCKTCGQFFGILSEYNSHRKTHTKVLQKNVKTKCDTCDKMFTDLKAHIRSVHQKIREHICSICCKAFGKKSGLDRHITTVHDKMRHWPCDLCDKRFGEKTLLTRHRKIHFRSIFPATSDNSQNEETEDQEIVSNDKKRMCCGVCKKILNSRAALKRHKLLVHEKKQDLLCDFCPKLFGEKSNLSRHIRRVHAKEVDLVKAEPTEITDGNHVETVSEKNKHFSCSSCDKILTTKWGFQSHQEICRIKQQQKFNDQNDEDRRDAKDDENEKHDENNYQNDRVENNKDEFDYKVDKDMPNLIRMEQIFLVTEEVEPIDVKEEVISMDEGASIKTSLKIDPDSASEEVLSNHCVPKVEVRDDFIHTENPKPLVTLPEVDDAECSFIDSFENISSDDDHKLKEGSENSSNDDESDFQSISKVKKEYSHSEVQQQNDQDAEDDDDKCRTCNRCDPPKVFQNKNCFRRHTHTVHSGRTFTCNQCERMFSTKTSLARHIKSIHANIRNYKCDEVDCNKCFVNKCDLEQHLIGSHNKGDQSLRTCKLCLKVFKNAKYLKTHVSSVHNTERQLSCPICQQSFSFHRSMVRHIQAVHENRKDFKCTNDDCLKEFRSRYELNEHFKNIHATKVSVKSVTCDICEKIFSSRKSLYGHKKIVHEGVRWKVKYQCRLCKEVFKTKYNKNKHWNQVHHNGKLILRTCQLCGSDFKLFDEFKDHIESHVGAFICIICGTNFAEESSLYIHMEDHKKIEEELRRFVCDICSHRLSTKSQLSIHMRKHFSDDHYVCDVCGKSYKFIAPFLYHKKGHENQLDFPCRYCQKQFRISRDRMLHERSHTGEKPYKCNQCKKCFAQKAIYYNHLKTHEVKGYNCKTCGSQFASDLKLRQHVDSEHPDERPFRCWNCRKSFKASKALEVHKHKCDTVRDTDVVDMRLLYF